MVVADGWLCTLVELVEYAHASVGGLYAYTASVGAYTHASVGGLYTYTASAGCLQPCFCGWTIYIYSFCWLLTAMLLWVDYIHIQLLIHPCCCRVAGDSHAGDSNDDIALPSLVSSIAGLIQSLELFDPAAVEAVLVCLSLCVSASVSQPLCLSLRVQDSMELHNCTAAQLVHTLHCTMDSASNMIVRGLLMHWQELCAAQPADSLLTRRCACLLWPNVSAQQRRRTVPLAQALALPLTLTVSLSLPMSLPQSLPLSLLLSLPLPLPLPLSLLLSLPLPLPQSLLLPLPLPLPLPLLSDGCRCISAGAGIGY